MLCSMVVCCMVFYVSFVFFKQNTAYEMRISDWSADVCSSDLIRRRLMRQVGPGAGGDTTLVADRPRRRLAVTGSSRCGGRRTDALPRITRITAAGRGIAAFPTRRATAPDRKSVV